MLVIMITRAVSWINSLLVSDGLSYQVLRALCDRVMIASMDLMMEIPDQLRIVIVSITICLID